MKIGDKVKFVCNQLCGKQPPFQTVEEGYVGFITDISEDGGIDVDNLDEGYCSFHPDALELVE